MSVFTCLTQVRLCAILLRNESDPLQVKCSDCPHTIRILPTQPWQPPESFLLVSGIV